jgi:glutaredoxin
MSLFDDVRQIAGQMSKHRVRLDLTIHSQGEDTEPERGFREIAEILAGSGGQGVILRQSDGGGVPARPALSLCFAGRGRVNYLALPEDQEAGPFLEMLSSCLPSGPAVDRDLKKRLEGLADPAEVWIFIAPACPYCPHAVRAANKLAAASGKVNTTIIDAARFPEVAARLKVRSVPMIVINEELLIDEVRPAEDLARVILTRGRPAYRLEVIESQVKTGNSELAADQLLRINRAVPAFFEAWQRSTLSTRMGLYLAAEKALAQAPRILDDIVPGLVELLDTSDIAVKGDTADLLGRIGHPAAKLPLEGLLQDTNPDIVEVAEEALKNLSPDQS